MLSSLGMTPEWSEPSVPATRYPLGRRRVHPAPECVDPPVEQEVGRLGHHDGNELPVRIVHPGGATGVGTLLQHTNEKSAGWLTNVSSPADLSCPSWARTRTLLIQSPPAWAGYSDNLLGNGHFPSIGARFPAVVCPVLPAETTAKLRRSRGWVSRLGFGSQGKPNGIEF